MEAGTLVSISRVLCTADSFLLMLNYDGQILVGTKLSLSLDNRDHILVARGRWWVRHELSPSALAGLVAAPHVGPHCLFLI